MRIKKDNRGSAMIIIIVVIAFVSILISTLYTVVTMNLQMKSIDRKAKKNFYSAEGVLEQINLGLQKEMSDVSSAAYAEIMQNYSTNVLEAQKRLRFNTRLIGDMQTRLQQAGDPGKYDAEHLKNYLTADVKTNTVISSNSYSLEKDAVSSSLVLKGVVVTYTDTEGFQSVIETDIRVNAPNLNFIQPSDMPGVFEYSLVANRKLEGTGATGNVEIYDNVYAGSDGIQLKAGDRWNFSNAARVVAKGSVDVPYMASLNVGSDTDLWTTELQVERGTVRTEGRTYVADDLIMEGQGSNVTLAGEYYGYGNGTTLNDSGVAEGTDGNSSAILINGTNSTLDMTNLRRLLLSGSAQVATGSETYDPDSLSGIKVENGKGLSDTLNMDSVKFADGTFQITSVGRNLLWCSTEAPNYFINARTDTNNGQGWEQFQLINNSDNTVSFRDGNANKYVSVRPEDYSLRAAADSIGPAEKFWLGSAQYENKTRYVLKAYMNDKFVSVDAATGQLYANRDKVTGKEQLFAFDRRGVVVEEEPEPTVTWTFVNNNEAYITFGAASWLTSKDPEATLYYRTSGSTAYTPVAMTVDTAKYFTYYSLNNSGVLWVNAKVDYYFVYKTPNGEKKTQEYTYTHVSGVGNVGGEGLAGTVANPKLANGVYNIEVHDNNKDVWENGYIRTDDKNGRPWEQEVKRDQGGNDDARIVLVNNEDGTVSFRSKRNGKYASVQTSGIKDCIVMNADTIGAYEKFTIEYGDEGPYYRLKLKHTGQYIYLHSYGHDDEGFPRYVVNGISYYRPPMVMDSSEKIASMFRFNWLEYTTEKGQMTEVVVPEVPKADPIYGMSRDENQDDRATVTFRLGNVGYTLNGATLVYSINGGADVSVEMPVNNGVASAAVSGLNHGASVNYFIYYVCSDNTTRNIARNIYVHERKYGAGLSGIGTNQNVNLGESIEVKSNQIAYLIPTECIGVNNGETIFGQNPMSAEDYARMLAYDADEVNYPDFEMVSFTKNITGLNKTLNEYRTVGTQGYQMVFSQMPGGSTMVYFYVDFDSDNASKYFREYYQAHQSTLESYMGNYVNSIKMSNRFTRLMLDGNMVYSDTATSGRINLYSNEGYGAALDAAQQSGLQEEELGYMKRYNALTTKLVLDYESLSGAEKTRDLFDNIVRDTAFAGIPDTGTFYPAAYGSDTIYAMVIDGDYVYDGTGNQQKLYLILANGDVRVKADYNGIIIAKGTITIDNGVSKIASNKELLRKILQAKVDNTDPNSKSIVEQFFINGENYVLEQVDSSSLGDSEYADYARCISYENWTKR